MSGATLRILASEELLGNITAPTLVMHGDSDNLIPVAHGQKFADAIPGAELIIYPQTGHIPQEEKAAESVADLRAFLAGLHAEETPSDIVDPLDIAPQNGG